MPECESQKVVKPRVWIRNPRPTPSATAAYDMADREVSSVARKWFEEEIQPNARCPEGCEGPLNLRYAVKRIKVYGRRSREDPRNYIIWILCQFTATWDCRPRPVEEPVGEADDGDDETGITIDTGSAGTQPPADNTPCIVNISMTRNTATRSTPGVFDLTIDWEFLASATNQTHSFNPGATKVTKIECSSSGKFGLLEKLLGRVKDVTAVLNIVNGDDDATVTGTLRDTQQIAPGIRLRLMAGTRLRATVTTVDSNGDIPPGGTQSFLINPQ